MKSLRILVLEDDELQIDLVRRFLSHEGFVVEVSEGPGALAREAAALLPDFILLDVNVPGVGRADLGPLVASLRACRARVLLFSAEDEAALRALVAGAGADGYLSKGTSLLLIAQKLKSMAAERGR